MSKSTPIAEVWLAAMTKAELRLLILQCAQGSKIFHTLDISVEKKQVTSQQRSQHSQQNYHKNLGLRKTLHPPKSTRLKLP